MSSPKKIKLWHLCLPLLTLANVAYLTHNIFASLFTLTFFLFVPGYLMLRSLLDTKTLGVAKICLSVGLSLALLTVCGLILHSLRLVGVAKPLESLTIFIALDSMILFFLYLNRSVQMNVRPNLFPALNAEEWLFGFLFSLLPVLAVFGAFRLNNGAPNILTMMMIALVGILFIALAVRPTMQRIYPYVLFMAALSFLLALSLRGWSITGHDIHHEFGVFSTTMRLGYWSPLNDFGDPYNACLSITILPTILAKISHVDPIYIYKVVFQVAFAAIVPAVYLFARKFVTAKQALIGAFAFITFPTFINDLPFLNRQEIAFAYFILILLVNFSKKIPNRAKSILTVFLLVSLIFSHYSTSYVTISVLLLASILYKVLSVIYKNKSPLKIPLLSLPVLILAFLATFAWNFQITSSSSNLSNTLTSAKNSIVGSHQPSTNTFSEGIAKGEKVTADLQLARIAAQRGMEVTYVPNDRTPLTPLGEFLAKSIDVITLNTRLHDFIAILLQLFVVAGTCILYITYFKKKPTPKQIYILAIGSAFLAGLVLFTLVPQFSIGYDVTRLFQQSLTVLWLPVIVFLMTAFRWLGKYALVAATSVLVAIYLNLSGFTTHLTGGYLPNLVLNNSGFYYNFFYTHRSDEVATQWLASPAASRLPYMTIFMDINSASPPLRFPVAIGLTDGKSQGYYYTDYTNNTTGHYRTIIQSGSAEYTSPAFTTGKSLIYSNGPSRVYFTWPSQ